MLSASDFVAVGSFVCTTFIIITYAKSVLHGKVKPHLFSWVIWAVLSGIASFAQFSAHAGMGAWTTGYNAVFNLSIALLAIKHGEKHHTKSDWFALGTALLALPLWVATQDPLFAILVVSAINVLAFAPTFRKSYVNPYEESLSAFTISILGGLLMLFSVEDYSLTTLLYPAVMSFLNTALVVLLIWRRQKVSCASDQDPSTLFHAARRMFALIDDKIFLAPVGDDKSHTEWFTTMGWIKDQTDVTFDSIIRGYSDGESLYAYRGNAFLGDDLVELALRHQANALKTALGLPATAPVFLGVQTGAVGEKMETPSPHENTNVFIK